MLNLWSQVGRVGCSCRCPSCLTTKHALVRRVSTVIGRIRARPKASYTLLYSAIFAAATVTDGHFKRQRRAHWDDAISKAQEKLETSQRAIKDHPEGLIFEADATLVEEKPGDTRILPEGQLDVTEAQPNGQQENGLEDSLAHLMDVENVMIYAPKPGARRPPDPRTTQPNYYPSRWGREFSAPQSLWSGHLQRATAYQRIWSKKKIAKAELAAARLAVELIMLVDLDSISMINLVILPEAVHEIVRLSRAEQRQLLLDLRADLDAADRLDAWESRRGGIAEMTIPQYSQREDKSHYPIVEELNESILGLIRAYKKHEIPFVALIVKIVHNLLISPAPPNLQTINILLLGFHKLDSHTLLRHHVVDNVAHFCRTVKVRPNEITCATILASYVTRNKPEQFAQYIGLMRAADGTRGLMLAKPGISITEASQGRLVSHDERGDKVFQAVNPSALVFWQVIRGVLKFSGVREAIEICKNFGKLAWGLDRTCLFELLKQCVKEEDWDSGRWVWDQVQIFHQRHQVDVGSMLGMMLALCLRCNERNMFDKIFKEGLNQKFKVVRGQVTPAILTHLAEGALNIVDRHGQEHGDLKEGEKAEGEVGNAEDGEEEYAVSHQELARARRILGMGMKQLTLHDRDSDPLPAVSLKEFGLDWPSSGMWDEEPVLREESQKLPQQRSNDLDDQVDNQGLRLDE